MQRSQSGVQFLTLIVLLVIVGISKCEFVSASLAAIVVYDHGFTMQISWTQNGHFIPGNKTSTFTQDDPTIYAYVTAAFYSANLTWKWYNPYGELYQNRTDQDQCNVAPCTFVYWFNVADHPPAKEPGLWRMDLLANGFLLYSDYFSITPIITQDNDWRFIVVQSAPPRVRGYLTVTIHPNNETWSSYEFAMPFAANVTAYEVNSNRTLKVTTSNSSVVTVDLGGARTDGYQFVLSFDLQYDVRDTDGWSGGTFAFTWQEYAWERFDDVHPVPETFNITLPEGSTLLDVVGINAINLNHNVTFQQRPSILFSRIFPTGEQRFGWAIIYQDFTWRNSHVFTQAFTTANLQLTSGQQIPILPLTLRDVSLWTAVMSVFMLTASELLSPIYARTVINRKRLRVLALVLVAIFLIVTAYQVTLYQASVIPR